MHSAGSFVCIAHATCLCRIYTWSLVRNSGLGRSLVVMKCGQQLTCEDGQMIQARNNIALGLGLAAGEQLYTHRCVTSYDWLMWMMPVGGTLDYVDVSHK